MGNIFLTHGWESGCRCVGVSGQVACVRFQFLFCYPPLFVSVWHGSQQCVRMYINNY